MIKLSEKDALSVEQPTEKLAVTESAQPIEVIVDTSKIREEVAETVQKILDAKDLETEEGGKGEVVEVDEHMQELEAIAERLKGGSLKEQWTVVLPKTSKETAGHLRDFAYISPVIKGKQGDTVNIPYATDFDFELLGSVGAAFADSLGTIFGVTTATLQEAGGWARIPYKDLEKINSNLLDQVNKCMARAGVRAEDKVILEAINALTADQLAGSIDRSTGSAKFYASTIPEAIGKLLEAGKEANPGECVIYMTPAAYGSLLSELASSQPAAFARPDIIKSGRITQYMGVHIVVGAAYAKYPTGDATGTHYCCMLGRYKRGVVLAPKRDMMVETEKDTVKRSLKITGSHTLATKVVDPKELVRIFTSESAV